MEHLVYIHDTCMYHVDSRTPEEITEKCEECGDSDTIILSWEEGQQKEALDDYFAKVYKDPMKLINKYTEEMTRQELITGTRIYYASFREMIDNLFESRVISSGDLRKYTKLNRQAERKQLETIIKNTSVFNMGFSKKLTLKKNKK